MSEGKLRHIRDLLVASSGAHPAIPSPVFELSNAVLTQIRDLLINAAGGGGGGAPTNATYITYAAEGSLSAEKVLGPDVIMLGTLASRPAAGTAGRLFIATDSPNEGISRDNGSSWDNVLIDYTKITNKNVVNADVNAAAAIAESKLALNFPTHSNANDPSAGEKAALAGTSGSPGSGNKYVTDADPRNTNARTPTAHVLAGTAGLGAEHTVSGLTAGQVLRATGAATAAFQPIAAGDLPDHASSHTSGGSDSFVLGDEIEATGYVRAFNDGIAVAPGERGFNFTDSKSILQNCTDDFVNERFDLALTVRLRNSTISLQTGNRVVHRATIIDADVTTFNQVAVVGFRRTLVETDEDDPGIIYIGNVVRIGSGEFDVLISALDWGQDTLEGENPDASVIVYYIVL